MPRQFVAVKFNINASRSYTYHNDGPPVRIGEDVKIEGRNGDGWQRASVVDVSPLPPPFKTKAILGKAPPESNKRMADNSPARQGGPQGSLFD